VCDECRSFRHCVRIRYDSVQKADEDTVAAEGVSEWHGLFMLEGTGIKGELRPITSRQGPEDE
jgi:hypothetical protein